MQSYHDYAQNENVIENEFLRANLRSAWYVRNGKTFVAADLILITLHCRCNDEI